MWIHAATLALGPVILVQARRARAASLDLPEAEGPRRGVEGQGPLRLRVTLVGDSSAAGVGVATQDQAVGPALARALASQLGGAVAWQVVAQTGLTSPEALALLRETELAPADVAVTMLGVNDVTKLVPLGRALQARAAIAEHLARHAGVRRTWLCALPEMEVFPALPQPLAWYAGAHARRVNRAQQRFVQGRARLAHAAMDGVMDASLFSVDGFHPAQPLYERIAARLAQYLAAGVSRSGADPV
jgi:lysophospholipase L1-like esterase